METGYWFDRLAVAVSTRSRRDFLGLLTSLGGAALVLRSSPATAAKFNFRKATRAERAALLRRAKAGDDFAVFRADLRSKGYRAGTAKAYIASGPGARTVRLLEVPYRRRTSSAAPAAIPRWAKYTITHKELRDNATNVLKYQHRVYSRTGQAATYVERVVDGEIVKGRVAPTFTDQFCTDSCQAVKAGGAEGIPCQVASSLWYILKCTLSSLGACVFESVFAENAGCKLLEGTCNTAFCRPDGGRCTPAGFGPRFDCGASLPGISAPGCCPSYYQWQCCFNGNGSWAGCCPWPSTYCKTLQNGVVGCALLAGPG